MYMLSMDIFFNKDERKEGKVLFNDAFNKDERRVTINYKKETKKKVELFK